MYVLKENLDSIFTFYNNVTLTARIYNGKNYEEVSNEKLKEIYDGFFEAIEDPTMQDEWLLLIAMDRMMLDYTEIEIKIPSKTFVVTSMGEIIDIDNQSSDEMIYRDAMRIFDFGGDKNEIAIYKYKGTEKTLKFPKTIAGETVTTLGSGNENESIIGTGCAYAPLNELAYDEENDKDIEFKKENFEAIKNALIRGGITAASSCNSFEELTEILCAYEVNGQWYSIVRETEEGIEFVNKDANLGVTKVIIPDNITTINYYALSYDPWLTSVYISANTISNGTAQRSIRSSAFECASPELKIYVETPEGWGEEQKLEALDKCFSDSNDGELLYNVIWSDEPNYVAP